MNYRTKWHGCFCGSADCAPQKWDVEMTELSIVIEYVYYDYKCIEFSGLYMHVTTDVRLPATTEDLPLPTWQQLFQPSGKDILHT